MYASYAAVLAVVALTVAFALVGLDRARSAPEPGYAALLLNMDRHPERLGRFERRARAARIDFERVPGVDASGIDAGAVVDPAALRRMEASVRRGYRLEHRDLTPGSVGCYLGHLAVLERHLASDRADQVLLVFEDDADVPRGFWQSVRDLTADGHPWDVLLLGSLNDAPVWERQAGPSVRVSRFYLTHAYAVTPRGARTILEHAMPIRVQYDSLLADLAQRGKLVVRAASEDAVRQDGLSATSIQTLGVAPGALYFPRRA